MKISKFQKIKQVVDAAILGDTEGVEGITRRDTHDTLKVILERSVDATTDMAVYEATKNIVERVTVFGYATRDVTEDAVSRRRRR